MVNFPCVAGSDNGLDHCKCKMEGVSLIFLEQSILIGFSLSIYVYFCNFLILTTRLRGKGRKSCSMLIPIYLNHSLHIFSKKDTYGTSFSLILKVNYEVRVFILISFKFCISCHLILWTFCWLTSSSIFLQKRSVYLLVTEYRSRGI